MLGLGLSIPNSRRTGGGVQGPIVVVPPPNPGNTSYLLIDGAGGRLAIDNAGSYLLVSNPG